MAAPQRPDDLDDLPQLAYVEKLAYEDYIVLLLAPLLEHRVVSFLLSFQCLNVPILH